MGTETPDQSEQATADPQHSERGSGRAVGASAVTLTSAHTDGVVERMRAACVNLGPSMWLTVAGPAQHGGTLAVVLNGRTIELEVAAGETAEQVARRLADALNAGSSPA